MSKVLIGDTQSKLNWLSFCYIFFILNYEKNTCTFQPLDKISLFILLKITNFNDLLF